VNIKDVEERKDGKMDQFFVKPLGNRVLVRLAMIERKTPGGIVQPQLGVNDVVAAIVLLKGLDVSDDLPIKVGDIVHFNTGSGQPIAQNTEVLYVVSGDALIAVEDPSSVKIVEAEDTPTKSRILVAPKTIN
jgi:co-chaperonin GroES (HSP10)